jgi:hypothetical protein
VHATSIQIKSGKLCASLANPIGVTDVSKLEKGFTLIVIRKREKFKGRQKISVLSIWKGKAKSGSFNGI